MTVKDAKLFINGEYVDALSGQTFDTFNPATNEKLASVANGGTEDAKRAIDAAQRAFESGIWSKMPVEERSAILCKMADLIMEKVDELAYLETLDVGKPIKESREFDIPRAAQNFRFLPRWLNIWYMSITKSIMSCPMPSIHQRELQASLSLGIYHLCR